MKWNSYKRITRGKASVKRKRLINLIVLLTFLIYAVTPLSFHCIKGASVNTRQNIAINLQLYVLERMFFALSHAQDSQNPGAESLPFILLKKKRAVTPDEDLQKYLDPGLSDTAYRIRTPSPSQLFHTYQCEKEAFCQKSFWFIFSGLSPPAA